MEFLPTASIDNIRRCAATLQTIRRFFDELGFVEVRTPILSADSVVDRYVEPVAVADPGLPVNIHGTKTYYLQTSPEFAMKRLLAAGLTAIYQITPVFRKGDRGSMHNVEFTMLEWYRVGDDYLSGRNLLADLIEVVLGKTVQQRSFGDLFREQTGLDPHRTPPRRFREFADSLKIPYPDGFDDENWIDLIFSETVQPTINATLVYDFPAFQSQLAQTRVDADGNTVSERFELFLNGIELANGYHELLDAAELRQRFLRTNEQRVADGKPEIPVESRLLVAMTHGLPPCCGAALGLERLLMVQLGSKTIDEVFPFPIEFA